MKRGGKLASIRTTIDGIRSWLLPIVMLGGLYGFALVLEPKFSAGGWYVWRYLLYWLVTVVWLGGCFSFGHAVIARVLRSPLPVLERVTMNFAVGLLGFFLLMYVGGLAHLFGSTFFVALPCLMIASGARPSFHFLRRAFQTLNSPHRCEERPLQLRGVLLWGLGVIALFVFYLPAIVPSNIGYDSAWYHVPLGEHYARLGGIEPAPEGWHPAAIPHLPSIVYCYAFLLPHGRVFDFIELSAHLEFGSLLMMLPGIPALVRRLAPGTRASWSWAAFFAFPALYWYDILIGGDQFSAVWSIPICLALLRTWPSLDWRHGLLLAAALAGEAVTKYSASGILVGPAIAVAVRMIWLGALALWRRRRVGAAVQAMSGAVVTGLAVLLLSTPFWAKNWIWYGDPFYPLLQSHFPAHPWTRDATTYFTDYLLEMQAWRPAPGLAGLRQTFDATLKFAFKPADFSEGPYRGALFTLMCTCLPFVRARPRVWGTALVVHVAIFFWYLQMHQDRYLLAFTPAMAAVAVAIAALAWRVSWAARVSVVALWSFHSLWGLSMFALSTPNSRLRTALDFFTAAAANAPDAGMGELARWERVGLSMPKRAKVLVHNMHFHTGIGHPSVSDWPRIAGGSSYGRLNSPVEIYEQLRRFEVTHLVWSPNWGDDSIAGDLRFDEFVTKYASPKVVEGLWVGTMPVTAPPFGPTAPLIAFLGCDRYAPGLYRFADMTVPNPRNIPQPEYPKPLQTVTAKNQNAALDRAQYAVLNPSCGFETSGQLDRDFINIGQRGEYTLFAKKDVL